MHVKDILSELLPLLNDGEETFFPIYRTYFDLLEGDVWACIIMSEVLRLQASEGGKSNGGWVVWTFETIQKKYYISRHIFNKSAERLEQYGLERELRQHPSYPEAMKGVWHYRINPSILKQSVLNYLSEKNDPSSKIFTTPSEKFSDIKDVLDLQEDLKTYPTTLERVLVNPKSQDPTPLSATPPSSSSKKKTTPTDGNDNLPVIPPAPRPASDVQKMHITDDAHESSQPKEPTEYQKFRRHIGRVFFGIADALAGNEKENGRLNLLAGYVWTDEHQPYDFDTEDKSDRADRLIKDLMAFVDWYRAKYKDASLPRHPEKFSVHWLAFLSTRLPKDNTAYSEGVLWNDFGDYQARDNETYTDTAGGDDTMGIVDFRDVLNRIEGGDK